jgi:hypothetical protein
MMIMIFIFRVEYFKVDNVYKLLSNSRAVLQNLPIRNGELNRFNEKEDYKSSFIQ